ncbi:MAG TPA: hypothetical protein VGR22_08740 [Thermomicrobiales bacterium]|nr:hypothetical protein [Thermomicrobiales bacterium]
MSQEQRNRIVDALEKLLDAHMHRQAPRYRVGDRPSKSCVGGHGLEYRDVGAITLREGRAR